MSHQGAAERGVAAKAKSARGLALFVYLIKACAARRKRARRPAYHRGAAPYSLYSTDFSDSTMLTFFSTLVIIRLTISENAIVIRNAHRYEIG